MKAYYDHEIKLFFYDECHTYKWSDFYIELKHIYDLMKLAKKSIYTTATLAPNNKKEFINNISNNPNHDNNVKIMDYGKLNNKINHIKIKIGNDENFNSKIDTLANHIEQYLTQPNINNKNLLIFIQFKNNIITVKDKLIEINANLNHDDIIIYHGKLQK